MVRYFMEFTKLTENTLPEPNKLIWIKRKSGGIYLGHRLDQPISTDEDASINCHWYGNPEHCMLYTERSELKFRHNFSDVTVEGWAELVTP